MRIIGGKLKGRKIHTSKEGTYRPTTGMIKEATFNILASGQFLDPSTGSSVIEGATIIDLFGGTGNLSFEALSRGASKAIIIDKDSLHIDLLRYNADKLGVANDVMILRTDSTRLPDAITKCSIAFIDPPFNKSLVNECVKSLVNKKWLSDKAFLVIRTHVKDEYDISNFCELLFSRKYGKSLLSVYAIQRDKIS